MKKKDKFNHKDSQIRCLKYRKRILEISQKVSALHLGGAFSCLEIVDCIYYGLMSESKKKNNNDIFIMSKGHGCMSQYVVLENKGILTKKNLDEYCTAEGFLGCHPDLGNPGINASTGSLGHGMALSVGVAHALKIKNLRSQVFVVLSDGELQEGSTWEAMMMAANLNLDNLICFLDHNGSQSFGKTKITHPKFYPIKEKIKSFGWVCKNANGHKTAEILRSGRARVKNKPVMVICNTVKGKGVKFMENKPIWHYRSPTIDEFKIAMKGLKKIKN